MTTPQEVGIRVQLYDEASRPIGELRREVQQASGGMRTVGRDAEAMASGMTRAETAGARFGTTIGRLTGHLLVADHQSSLLGSTINRLGGIYAGAQVVRFGLHAVESAQQAQGAFTGLLGSGEKAKQLYTDLSSIKNPFGLNAITSGAQNLLGFGIAADKVLPGVQAIADAVAQVHGNSSAFSSVAGTLGTISGSAKLTSDQLRQLQQQGIDAADVIGKAHGLTSAQVVTRLDSGRLKITGAQAYDDLIGGFQQQAAGSAATASQTLQGTLSGLSDRFAKSINQAIGPDQLTQLTHAVQGMAQILPPLATAATPFLHVLGDTLGFLGEHPHITEALAGFLIFREVAGPAANLYQSIRGITGALSSGNTGGALQQLLGVAGAGASAAGAADASGGSGVDLSSTQDHLQGTRAGRALEQAGIIATAVGTVVGVHQGIGAGGRWAQDRFGHGYDNRSWHWQDVGRGAAETGQYAADGAVLGAAAGLLGGPLAPLTSSLGAAIGGTAGAVFGVGKSTYDYFHDKQGYSLSSKGRAAMQAAMDARSTAAAVNAPISLNVTAGASAEDVLRAAQQGLTNNPGLQAQLQALLDRQRVQDRERGR